MDTVRTYCRICEAACGLVAEVDGGQIVKLSPDAEHPVTRGYACVKGPAMLDVHRDPDRVARPERRDGARFVGATWDEAVRDIGARLRAIRARHGDDAVAVYLGNPSAFSVELAVFTAGFVGGLGTRNFYSASSLDCQNKFAVAERMFGSYVIQPIPDLDRTDFFLCLGSNPVVSQMSFVAMPRALERMRAIVARGGRVVMVNPRRTETAHAVGEHVFIRPDTDAFLLLAMLRVLFDERRVRTDAPVRGADELARVVADVDVRDAADATGIAADTIVELARAFAGARSANAYCSTGVNQGSAGSLAFFAVQALNAVTGNLDRAGGALVPSRAIKLARVARWLDALRKPRPSRVGGFETVAGTLPTGVLADEILTPGVGQVRALVVLAGNPLLSAPGGARLERALASLELLVSIDLYRNDTGALAHWVLPTTDFLEREDMPLVQAGMQPEPYAQIAPAVVPARDERRGEARILVDLARAAGVRMFRMPGANWALARTSPRRVMSILCRAVDWPARAARTPGGVRLPDDVPGAFVRARPVDVAPRDVLAAAPAALARMHSDAARVRAASANGAGAAGLPLRLIGRRQRRSHNSWMHNVPKLRPEGAECQLAMHPADAAARGLADGARVAVSSASGRVEVALALDDDVMPGTVSLPHGWGHSVAAGWRIAASDGAAAANANALAADGPSALERLSGMVQFNGIEVDVTAA
jgi:anaerobic selenocysteine-containing dehydrogenase